MSFVATVGAGEVGGMLAHALARRDCVEEIRLLDEAGDIAAGKALDLQQAGAVEGFHCRLTAFDDVRAAAGAAVTVLADPATPTGTRPSLDDRLALLERLARLDPATVFVGALPADRLLVERGVGELGLSRARVVGSAPLAYEAAVSVLVALALDRSPRDLSLIVVGAPPERAVVLWASASVGSGLVEDTVPPAVLAAVRRRLDALPPPGPLALALAAARFSTAIVCGSRRRHTGFVALEGELGVRGRAAALPLHLGPGGIRRVVIPTLSARERVGFDNALARFG